MWDAAEKAEHTNLSVLPALNAPRPQGAQKHSLRKSKCYRRVIIDFAHPCD